MSTKLNNLSPWLTLAGVVTLLVGLAWDAALHAADPDLAAEEGIFTLSNPGHILFGAGIAVIVAGSLSFLYGRYAASGRLLALAPAAALVALGGVSFVSAMSVDGGLSGGHSHGEVDASHGHGDESEALAVSEEGGHSHDDNGAAASEAELAEAEAFREEALEAIQRFADFSTAEAEGYIASQPQTVGPVHYPNPRYTSDGTVLVLENPETLVYLLTPDGDKFLLGAAYKAPYGTSPEVAGGQADWHSHFKVCFTPDGEMMPREGFSQCPIGTAPPDGAVEMVHVWFFDNPDGPFEGHLSATALLAAYEQTTGQDGEALFSEFPQLRERLEREMAAADGHAENAGHSHDEGEGLSAAHELHGTSDPEAEGQLYARSLRDAARFSEFSVAEEEGFDQTTPFRNGSWGPAHYRNVAYTRDGVPLDSERPENLVYIKTQDGEMILAGVMYVAHTSQLDPQSGLEWHTHNTGCVGPSGVAPLNAEGTCPAGSILVPKEAAMLHVWFFNHPDGLLAHSLTPEAIEVAIAELA